jgi:hypothetical protein
MIVDKIEGACSTHGRQKKCIQTLGWKNEEKRSNRRLRRIWESNIKDLTIGVWIGYIWLSTALIASSCERGKFDET